MPHALKRHVQQEIRWLNAAGDLRGRKREAKKRRGKKAVGRPKKPNSGVPHTERAAFKSWAPLHVTLRVLREIGRLRTRAAYKAIREAAITVLRHESFRITQLSIQGTHIHLLVEAENRGALSLGMKAFGISAAKHLNAAVSFGDAWWDRATRAARARARASTGGGNSSYLAGAWPERRKGRVFSDRYHARIIESARQARNELAYVLNNWRKHREDRGRARAWLIDPFATGWCFDGWKEREDEPFVWKLRDTYEPIPVWRPTTWLLSTGWRRYGLISTHEVPSERRGPQA
jgi:REP element-mobilizing transposase RayT